MHNTTHTNPLGQNTETNATVIRRVMEGKVTTAFQPKPLPSISRRVNRGEAEMLLGALRINHAQRRLAESRRETLQVF